MDMVKDLAVLMLQTAVTVAQDVAEAAVQLESMLTGLPRDDQSDERPGVDDDAVTLSAPPSLELPDVSPGGQAKADFVVRNSGLDTVDGMRVRCRGLFATGELRIAGERVKFAPPTVDVPPRGTAAVTCTVHVPSTAKRGHYSGVIEATDRPGVQLLALLHVV
jgi:hypothetical protein